MTRHSEKIFRTVVFAGAMLGAPLASADAPQKPQAPKPADKDTKPKPPDTVDSVTKELAALDVEIKKATDAIASAQSAADRDAAKAKLDAHKKLKTELDRKLADLKKGTKPAPATPLAKLEQDLAAIKLKVDAAVAAVADAQNDAERKAAKAKLAALQQDKTEIEKKITAEKQKLARPRTPENDRPIGRGFVLA